MSIKALGKQSLIYGVGHVMARLITFLLLPLYTHAFTQVEYGALSLAYAFMGFALIIYRYGMDTALMKYSVQRSGQNRKKYITIIVGVQAITGILFTLLLYLSRNFTAIYVLGIDRPDWMIYLAVILFFDSMWNLPMLILRSEERAGPFISFNLLNVILTMVLNILFVVYWDNGIEGVFKANIIASSFVFFFSLPIILKRIELTLFEKEAFINIMKFALPFLPAGIFTMIMELSDRYLLEYYLGTAEVGLYSAGKKMGMLGLTAVMGFNMGWTPYFLKRGKEVGARIEFAKIATLFTGIMGYISMMVSIWISEIMQFSIFGRTLIGAEFWSCEPVVSAILLGYFFFGTYVIQLPGIYMKEITNWVPVFRILGAMTLFLTSIWLIPTFGFIGAAYGVVLAFVVMSISIYIKTYRIYTVPYNWRGILFPIIFLIGIQFDFNHLLLKLFLSMVYPVFWYLFIINQDEKKGLLRLFK
jgi:O-antigen/teichoic acid export membrane protein